MSTVLKKTDFNKVEDTHTPQPSIYPPVFRVLYMAHPRKPGKKQNISCRKHNYGVLYTYSGLL